MSDDNRARGLPPFPPHYRASGLLMHITSLPSPYGIGDVGPAALSWIDRLHEAGQTWWQALPLGPTGYGNSPYQPMSSFVGNVLLISPDWLIEDGLLRAKDCTAPSSSETKVDYGAVIPFKHRLLQRAWSTFSTGTFPELRAAFEQFCHDQAHWLDEYALFRALKARYDDAYYLEWPVELVKRVPAALDRARRDLASDIDQVRFAQFLLFRQGDRLRRYARTKGVRLIGDLPFFVSPDSSDVCANPNLFLLDEQRRPQFVAGVAPRLLQRPGTALGQPRLQLGGAATDRLSLVHRSTPCAARPRGCDPSRSFSCVRGRVAYTGRGNYSAIGSVGAGSGRGFFQRGEERVRRITVHR